jgi:hypothetical protein
MSFDAGDSDLNQAIICLRGDDDIPIGIDISSEE